MARYTVYNKNTGDLVCRIVGHDQSWSIIDNDKLSKAMEPHQLAGLLLCDALPMLGERFLVKDDGIGINGDPGEDVAAQPGEPAQGIPSQVLIASEDVNERVVPAIKILKEIVARAEVRRKDRAEAQAHIEALALEAQNASVVMEQESQYYVTMDGDGIGNQVARAQYTDDEIKVKEISRKIDGGMHLFTTWATMYGGIVIEAGGDEGQVKVSGAALDHIEEFRANYKKLVGATVTVGIGKTISQSIQARELGKLRGKNQVVYWDENTEKELTLRMEQKGESDAAQKLKDSGVLGEPDQAQPKLGQVPEGPARASPKFGVDVGEFEDNKRRQVEYEQWLDAQKRELSS